MHTEKLGEYIFKSLAAKNKLIYIHLCEKGDLYLNIDCPQIKSWEYKGSQNKITLKNIDGGINGEIFDLKDKTYMLLFGESFVRSHEHHLIDDTLYTSLQSELGELDINKNIEIDLNLEKTLFMMTM